MHVVSPCLTLSGGCVYVPIFARWGEREFRRREATKKALNLPFPLPRPQRPHAHSTHTHLHHTHTHRAGLWRGVWFLRPSLLPKPCFAFARGRLVQADSPSKKGKERPCGTPPPCPSTRTQAPPSPPPCCPGCGGRGGGGGAPEHLPLPSKHAFAAAAPPSLPFTTTPSNPPARPVQGRHTHTASSLQSFYCCRTRGRGPWLRV